jgi:3-oxoacyl-[acyl-carrier protein] reductase
MERALVTGGSRSIGRGIVQRLVEDGYEVVILDRVEPDPPLQTRWINVDLMNADAIHAALDDVLKDGPITRVCHNVGHVKPADLDGTTLEDFDAVMGLNVKPILTITQRLVEGMRAEGFGRIVSISSRAAMGKQLRTAYSASKAAIHGMTRTWALELARSGITVNAIGPGAIQTPLWAAANPDDDPRTQRIIDGIPVGRLGTPEDIANGVSFFMDKRSGFVTGQVMYICGGYSIGAVGAGS